MSITLTSTQIRWLESEVAAGRLPSIEDGVHLAVAAMMQDAGDTSDDDLDWAKPLVDEALAEIDLGEGIPADRVRAERDAYLKSRGAR